MRFLLLFVVAAVVVIVALAVRAPATLIDSQIKNVMAGNVRLSDATGTIWDGAGVFTLTSSGLRIPVRWKIDALPLLRGEVSGTVATSTTTSPGEFVLDGHHVTLRNVGVSMPMDALLRSSGVGAPFAAAGGTVDVHVDTLTRRDDGVDGSLSATWSNATVPGPRPDTRYALGDVRVDASGSGPEIPGTVSNTGGDVDIKGNLTLSGSAARGEVVISPRPGIDGDRASAINAALSAVGQPNGAGGFRLVWSTRMR
jgi:general secretion pathway protein N